MSEAVAPSPLEELASRGGDLAQLKLLAKDQLQSALKALGYTKLGDRARIITAIKGASSVSAAEATKPAAATANVAAAASAAKDAPGTLVMHGAVHDFYDDGGLLKTTLKAGSPSTAPPPPLSSVKVRYVASVLPECRRFEANVMNFQMGEHQVPRGLEKCISSSTLLPCMCMCVHMYIRSCAHAHAIGEVDARLFAAALACERVAECSSSLALVLVTQVKSSREEERVELLAGLTRPS